MFQKCHFNLLVVVGFFLLMVACTSVQTTDNRNLVECDSILFEPDILACYNNANAKMIARRIDVGTRHLTSGDWPNMFQILVQLEVENDGSFKIGSILNSSDSRMLNKKINQVLTNTKRIFVPAKPLFESARFSELKLLIKLAITPILSEEVLIDDGALVIYINKMKR